MTNYYYYFASYSLNACYLPKHVKTDSSPLTWISWTDSLVGDYIAQCIVAQVCSIGILVVQFIAILVLEHSHGIFNFHSHNGIFPSSDSNCKLINSCCCRFYLHKLHVHCTKKLKCVRMQITTNINVKHLIKKKKNCCIVNLFSPEQSGHVQEYI